MNGLLAIVVVAFLLSPEPMRAAGYDVPVWYEIAGIVIGMVYLALYTLPWIMHTNFAAEAPGNKKK